MSLFSFFSGIAHTAGQSKSSHQGLRLFEVSTLKRFRSRGKQALHGEVKYRIHSSDPPPPTKALKSLSILGFKLMHNAHISQIDIQ